MDREVRTLIEIGDIIISSVDKKTKDNERPIRLCNYTDVYKNDFIRSNMDFMTATATDHEIAKCTLLKGDVVITKDSEKYDDIGVPAFIKEDIDNLLCGYHLVILRPSTGKVDGAYLFYALNTQESKHQFHANANGITRFGLRKGDIENITIPVPPISEQRAIAHILGTLDDKIELNRRMNETLEAMARAIFKSWFVDFDPVRAKAEGRPTGLPEEIAALFPDSFEESELGEIPREWAVLPLSEILNIIGGGTPKTEMKEYWGGNIPWFSVVDAPSETDIYVIDTEKHITELGVENSSTRVLHQGTTIISARGTVGRCALVGCPMAMNQSCYGLQGKNEYNDYFIYFTIRSQVSDLQRSGHGSVFNTITRDTFKTIRIACPSANITKIFGDLVHPLIESILSNVYENTNLASLRDTLLPKLISGELRIPDPEVHMEAAI